MNRILKIISKNLPLILIIIFSLISLIIFAEIFEDLWTKDPGILLFDNNILNFVRENRTSFLNNFFKFITNFGEVSYVLIISAFAVFFLFFKKKYYYLIALFIALAGDALFVFVIKDIVKRARPAIANALITESGFSFPSGHSFIAVCFYGLITYFIFKSLKNVYLKILTLLIGVMLILLIPFSRIYLGVHFPSDVIASFVISSAFTIIIIYILEKKSLKTT